MAAILRTFALGLALTAAAAAQAAAPITYVIHETQGDASVTGFIKTDGVLGQVGAADILDWSFLLSDGTNTDPLSPLGKFTLNPGNSAHLSQQPGYYFYATATELQFNFSGTGSGVLFQTPNTGSNQAFLAYDSLGGGSGWGVSSVNWWAGGNVANAVAHSGTTPIATAVPEPSSCAMLGAGLGLLGWAARRRRA